MSKVNSSGLESDSMKKIIFVGPLDKGHIPCEGDTMKNQLFLKRFREVFSKVIDVDAYHWKKRPWCLLKLFFSLLANPKAIIIVSANSGSANIIIKILNRVGAVKRTYYWVVGGNFHKSIENHLFNVSTYFGLAGIFVQGRSMVESLNKSGLRNAIYVPNSKFIPSLPEKHQKFDSKIHFVFLSRIEREKGCDYIIKATRLLDARGYKNKYDITFFGKTMNGSSYAGEFKKQIDDNESLLYRGVLNLLDYENYQELAKYDVMLFPTYWNGEGFPGVVIDAYIAGLPVIASDWNLNKDVVMDGKTGWIIPVNDIEALALKMEYVIDNPEIVRKYSENSQHQAAAYDIRTVLSEDNMRRIGLL